ncbi:hypothetical protein LTR28_010418, partial [Elasticomyces elasticus]
MSNLNLLSSFFIDPVVRQARRFSSATAASAPASPACAPDPADAAPLTCESLPPVGEENADGDAVATHTAPDVQNVGYGVARGRWILDSLRERSPFVFGAGVGVGGGGGSGTVEQAVEHRHETLTASPLHESSIAFPDYAPEDDMSSNPSYGIPDHLRSEETLGSAASGPGSVSSSGGPRSQADTSTSRSTTSERYTTAKMSSSLPADDGMGSLRQQLHVIRDMAASAEEKAKRMHQIMTESYLAQHPETESSVPTVGSKYAEPDFVLSNAEQQRNAQRLRAVSFSRGLSFDPGNPYNVAPADLEPSYCPLPRPEPSDDPDAIDEDPPPPTLGCTHYKRNVKIQCADCNCWYPCRHCHDESPILPFPHALDRRRTQNMLCMLCRTPQPAAEVCRNCAHEAAYYYCGKCKLWDNDTSKRIYHCDDCGICRRGEGIGKDFLHCRRCGVCVSLSHFDAHPCIERATDCDCPICLVYLFNSPQSVVSLPCGHYMHANCYKQLMRYSYRCTVCNRSAVNMELEWRKLDEMIRQQPMPEEYIDDLPEVESMAAEPHDEAGRPATGTVRRGMIWVGCNDCGGRGWTKFHWLGNKCSLCDSYNTNQMNIGGGAETQATSSSSLPQQQQQAALIATSIETTDSHPIGAAALTGEAAHSRIDSALGSPPHNGPRVVAPNANARSPGRSYFLRAEEEGIVAEQQQQQQQQQQNQRPGI